MKKALATDRRIEALVYELCQLTKEQIGIQDTLSRRQN